MRSLVVAVIAGLVLVACGGDGDSADPTSSSVEATATTSTTTATTTTPPDDPVAEEPGSDDGAGGATLTIGDETWTFDSVEFCGKPVSPDTSSFVLIAKLGEWQLIAEVHDDSGEQRLDGDGVYDTINFQNNGDPTQSWLANLEAAEVKFIVIDGSSVTANTTLNAVTGLSDDTPGTLEATCP